MKKTRIPLLARALNVAPGYYLKTTEGTQVNFNQLAKALIFTVIICGSVLAASFCEFWLDHDYRWMPLVMVGTGLFYLILDQAIIMGDGNRNHYLLKRVRIGIALALALFNSSLIEYYYFKQDIVAARSAKLISEGRSLEHQADLSIAAKHQSQASLLGHANQLQQQLKADRDSLNAEIDGRGGSRRAGKSTVYYNKEASYKADSVAFSVTIANDRAAAAKIDTEILALRAVLVQDKNALPAKYSKGISGSLELLHEVTWQDGNFNNKLMSILILIVSMIMELVPLIVKDFYDISEYFMLIQADRKITEGVSETHTRNAINLAVNKEVYSFAEASGQLANEHDLTRISNMMDHELAMLQRVEDYLTSVEQRSAAWQQRFPEKYEELGRPAIEKAYATLGRFADANYPSNEIPVS